MSWQKCTSFSKCFNLEAKNVINFKLVFKEIKGRTVNSNKQNFENKLFRWFLCVWKSRFKQNSNWKQISARQKFKWPFYLNGIWNLKRFCITCIELIFRFLSWWVLFSGWILLKFWFLDANKTHLKSFVFEILFIGAYISTFLSLWWQSL